MDIIRTGKNITAAGSRVFGSEMVSPLGFSPRPETPGREARAVRTEMNANRENRRRRRRGIALPRYARQVFRQDLPTRGRRPPSVIRFARSFEKSFAILPARIAAIIIMIILIMSNKRAAGKSFAASHFRRRRRARTRDYRSIYF